MNDLPALTKPGITFGVCNRLIKVTDEMARVWGQVLEQVPNSRLLVMAEEIAQIADLKTWFSQQGVGADRLIVEYRRHDQPLREYYRLFHQIDVALDTFPYGGHTTTCDALWMGVPTITLAGEHSCSRAGVSVLSAVQLGDFISTSPSEYVTHSVAIAGQVSHLALLRSTLRERMSRSILIDAPALTCKLERVFMKMCDEVCRADEY